MRKESFPIEEIGRYPTPGYTAPSALTFSPDDELLAFLFSPERSLNRQLYAPSLKRVSGVPSRHPAAG